MMFARRFLIAIMLAIPTVAVAQDRGPGKSEIIDDAGIFSAAAVREAKDSLARFDRLHGVTLTIETVNSLRGQTIEEVISRRAEQLDQKGLFILIAKEDRKVEVIASNRTLKEQLSRPQLMQIRDSISDEFRKKQFDDGLARGIRMAGTVLETLRSSPAPVAGGASGTSSGLVLRQQVRLSLSGARKAVAGAEAKAAEKGTKMNIAVVDDGGHLLAFARMDGARPASILTSTTKAVAAATHRVATGPPTDLSTPPGGLPIVVDGQVIGAIGVGGGSNEEDLEIAKAGLAAFLLELKEGALTPGAPAIKLD